MSEEAGFHGLDLAQSLRRLKQAFDAAGIDSPDADARLLLGAATGADRAALVRDPDRRLDPDAARRLGDMMNRRLAGEPATRIAGSRGFWTLELAVRPDVLDPRPDSETIVEAALEVLGPRRDAPLRILDLGTGSGALLLALLSECPRATGLGVDLSPAACALAADNARANGLDGRASFRLGRWTEGLTERFDLIVSNPPYIETQAIATLAPEVRRHDPHLALDGGADGLQAYRDIIDAAPDALRTGGIVVLELGAGQAPAVAALAGARGLEVSAIRRDFGGIERALVLTLGEKA